MRPAVILLAFLLNCATGAAETTIVPPVRFDVPIHTEHGLRMGMGRVIEVRGTNAAGEPARLHYVSVHDPETLALWHLISRWDDAQAAVRDFTAKHSFVAGDGRLVAFTIVTDTLFIQPAERHVVEPSKADEEIIAAEVVPLFSETGIRPMRRLTLSMRVYLPGELGADFGGPCEECAHRYTIVGGFGKQGLWTLEFSSRKGERRRVELEENWQPVRKPKAP
jgi:hypothetical protein